MKIKEGFYRFYHKDKGFINNRFPRLWFGWGNDNSTLLSRLSNSCFTKKGRGKIYSDKAFNIRYVYRKISELLKNPDIEIEMVGIGFLNEEEKKTFRQVLITKLKK